MSRTNFTGSSGDVGLLNANFIELYDLRELIGTPSYAPSSPNISFDAGGRMLFRTTTAWATRAGPTSITPQLQVTSTGLAASAILGLRFNTDSTGPGVFLAKSRGTTVGDYSLASSADSLGNVNFAGADGVKMVEGAVISAVIESTPALDVMPTRLSLRTNDGTSDTSTERLRITGAGVVQPGADNTQTMGSSSRRWSVVYAGTGTINTSDEREKTAVAELTSAELAAAQALALEVGTFQFLTEIAAKGADVARHHAGLTVQRAMEVMADAGLDATRYGFICHDEWPEEVVPPVTREVLSDVVDANGAPVVTEVIVTPGYTRPAGDRYGFRTDELLLFIARGLAAQQAALEARVAALEAAAA